MAAPPPILLPPVRCDHCANDVPDGVFCTRCGAHQGTTGEFGNAKSREHRYAAHPGEHVAQPAIFTTLFPHLGHHKIHEFRWAFIAGLGGVLALYLAGLIAAAILLSAFLVPVLYLIYLYEAQVYRDEPALVLGFTLGGGLVVGVIVTLFERVIFNPFQYNPNPLGSAGISIGTLLVAALILPVVEEVLKAVPAYFLPNRADFPETVDGLVFGVAAGLGFSLAETLIGFASVLPTLGHVAPGNWIYTLATLAIFEPLLQGSATGMVVATIWRMRRGRLAAREIGGVVMAVTAHIAFAGGTQLMQDTSVNGLFILVWQAAVVGALLIYVRYLLHHALLEEAAHMGFSETVCPNCHMHIVASGFCPNCGVALTAAPNALKRNRRPRKDPAASPKGNS
jgi:RsiW-degrading membrane proteinase PrsW (M82 family)